MAHKEPMTRLNIIIPKRVDEALERYCKKTKISKGIALTNAFTQTRTDPKEAQKAKVKALQRKLSWESDILAQMNETR